MAKTMVKKMDPPIPPRKLRRPPPVSANAPEKNLPNAYATVPTEAMNPSFICASLGVMPCCAKSRIKTGKTTDRSERQK